MVDFVTQTDRYRGPDRRKAQRRQAGERREEFRFEPTKDDRRTGKDRRRQPHWQELR